MRSLFDKAYQKSEGEDRRKLDEFANWAKPKIQAELETIRKQGYAASLGERNPGLGSLSAPILDYRGSLLASISLAIPEMRYRDQKLRKKYVKELLQVAKNFSEAMGARDIH